MHFGVHIHILKLPVLPKVLRHIHNIQKKHSSPEVVTAAIF